MMIIPITIVNIYFIDPCIESTNWNCNVELTSDENGEIMVDYGNYAGLGIGKVYNPNFITNIEWFENNHDDYDSYYLVPYNYDWPIYNTNGTITVFAPFYSCEGQTRAMTLNHQMYNTTGEQKYLDDAYKYYYGVTDTFLNENYWVHGFYHDDIGGTYILNSQMYCLIAIYNFYEETNDNEIKEFFDYGIERLEYEIDWYTLENGTKYDKQTGYFKPHVEHPDYSKILMMLYEYTGNEKLAQVHAQWNR